MQLNVLWCVLMFGVSDCADFAAVRLHLGETRLLRQYRTEQSTHLLTCSIRCYGDLNCMAVNYNTETRACELNDRNGFYGNYRSEGQVGWSIYNIVERLCPESWVLNQTSCYQLSDTNANWTTAVGECQDKGGYLAEVNDQTENVYFKGKAQFLGENIWLGGSDLQEENVWRWEHSHTSVAYQGWHDGQPDNDQNKEHCLGIDSGYNWKWNDMQCRYNFKYVCEMPVDNEI